MKNCKALLFLVFMAVLLTADHSAAQSGFSDIAEMQKRMLELQRRMMQEFQRNSFGDLFSFPGDQSADSTFSFFKFDTTFSSDGNGSYFKFDTTYSDGSAMHFFRFSPFGNDSSGMQSPFSFKLEEFFGEPNRRGQRGRQTLPKDDGNREEDELLPEERLRQEEESQGLDQPNGKQPPVRKDEKPAPKKPRIQTTRI